MAMPGGSCRREETICKVWSADDWCSLSSLGSPHSLVFSGLSSGEFTSCSCVLSHVWLSLTPWTVALPAPLSMGFARARILEWVAISFFTRSSHLRDWTCISFISHTASRFFTTEPPGKPWESCPDSPVNDLSWSTLPARTHMDPCHLAPLLQLGLGLGMDRLSSSSPPQGIWLEFLTCKNFIGIFSDAAL